MFCQVGLRGYVAARLLAQHGFRVRNLSGGYKRYLMWQDTCEAPGPGSELREEDGRPRPDAAELVPLPQLAR